MSDGQLTDQWKSLGAQYLPLLHAAEDKYALPRDLLARIAFQESHFRPGIISGAIKSPVGAVGIMQLMPQFFPGAGADPAKDIDTAGRFLAKLYERFKDWQVAVAAYNWGQGNVHHEGVRDGDFVLADMPTETQNYVKQVFGDVPLMGALLHARA